LPIVLFTENASRERMEMLLSASDACLSLHRSEGLGMLPIESLYLGKPVVATGYGGVTDYLDESTGFPVEYALRRLESPHGPYPAGAAWAEPSLDDAAEKMRLVVEFPDLAGERARKGQERVRAVYSAEATGRRLAGEVRRILGPLECAPPGVPVVGPSALVPDSPAAIR
jgi:glycosyltransferase involved in cell wall biosynthesis